MVQCVIAGRGPQRPPESAVWFVILICSILVTVNQDEGDEI